MTTRGPTPHDALFRHVFSQPEHAAAELRHVLPPSIANAIDWTALRVVPGTWVDEELRGAHADILCSVPLAGHEVLVYVLLEHKSGADPMTPLQLLRYVLRIWQAWCREHPGTRTLPAVLPVVVHHGEGRWTTPTELADLLDLPPALRDAIGPFVPNFRFALDDLTATDEAPLRARAMAALPRLALFCLHRIRAGGDIRAALTRWADTMRAVLEAASGGDALAAVLSYIMQVGELPAAELREFLANEVDTEAESKMTNTWEQIKQEGRVEGLARGRVEGRVEGRAEGRTEGQIEVVIRLLTARFGALEGEHLRIIRQGSSEQLIAWAERVLHAHSADEVLGSG
jgi:predicted transposase YdaD